MAPINKQRAVANVRERKRTQLLNQAYKQLQSIIPKEPSDKMSKIHTLKLALSYIHFLNDILKTSDNSHQSSPIQSSSASLNNSGGQPDNNQLNQPSSPVYTSCSPTCSTGTYNQYMYSPASEEEEEDSEYYQPNAKRVRLNSGQSKATISSSGDQQHNNHHHHEYSYQQQNHECSPPPIIITNSLLPPSVDTNQRYITQIESNHIPETHAGYAEANQYYPTSSSVSSYYSDQMAPTPENITSNLRDAFREYRSMKRKSRI